MARTKEELPRWAKVLIAVAFIGIIIWAIVPRQILYLSIGIAVVIIGGIFYLIYRKRGITPFKIFSKKSYEWLKEEKERTQAETTKVPSLSETERAQLIDAVGNKCENPNCRNQYPLEVHHIVPREESGANKLSNLIVLCKNCHGMAGKGVYSKALLKQWILGQRRRRFRYYVKWNY